MTDFLCRTEHRKDSAQLPSSEYLELLGSEVDDFFEKELNTSHASLTQNQDGLTSDDLSAKSLEHYNPQVIFH